MLLKCFFCGSQNKKDVFNEFNRNPVAQYIKITLNLEERKRKYSLRSIWNAIHYLVKTGCQ